MIRFPKDFVFGWSQSGFQTEMGLKGSEDPNSDWFVWVHDKENISSGLVSGDLPENGPAYWHNYKVFHDNAERMGLKIYRAGIEWSRIFPKSTFEVNVDTEINGNKITYVDIKERNLEELDKIANKEAVEHYREIFKDIKNRGIKLILNLYHWPLPLWLHDPIAIRKGEKTEKSGWLNKRTVIEFAKFSAYVAWKFSDLVDIYSTMNEPNVYHNNGYVGVKSGFPPAYLNSEYSEIVRYNLIQAHARAYDLIKRYNGIIGMIYGNTAFVPFSEKDKEAAEKAEYNARWIFFDAITSGKIGNEVREDLKNKLDWIGVNYYSRVVVRSTGDGYKYMPGYGGLCEKDSISLDGRPCSDVGWEFYPEGLRDVIEHYWNRYKLPIYVTENGIADEGDYLRPYYLVTHIYQVYRAIQAGIDVRGYLHWSLADNYEWALGFSKKFGLLQVDYDTKKLYWRPSAFIYKEIAENNGITDRIEHLNRVPPINQLRR
ncbi:beta-galactosidase BgaS [Acidianus brierleyi]|uniref:beta-galactosidase BgaS n=1 Tax=Acidianus brierleyi TaxID=41673 RepID=UPI001443051A|nr:beta-galactosidase BgaS [Acidianus brierleyi]QIJ32826.1 family 1 glycosylhydrolase [Acidianus brierleyi]